MIFTYGEPHRGRQRGLCEGFQLVAGQPPSAPRVVLLPPLDRGFRPLPFLATQNFLKAVPELAAILNNGIFNMSANRSTLYAYGQIALYALEDAFKDLETSNKMPTLRECQNEFAMALTFYRDTVLRDVLSHAVSDDAPGSKAKLGKPTEWGGKKPWVKPPMSLGESSRMSTVAEEGTAVVQKFADDSATEEEVTSKAVAVIPKASAEQVCSRGKNVPVYAREYR